MVFDESCSKYGIFHILTFSCNLLSKGYSERIVLEVTNMIKKAVESDPDYLMWTLKVTPRPREKGPLHMTSSRTANGNLPNWLKPWTCSRTTEWDGKKLTGQQREVVRPAGTTTGMGQPYPLKHGHRVIKPWGTDSWSQTSVWWISTKKYHNKTWARWHLPKECQIYHAWSNSWPSRIIISNRKAVKYKSSHGYTKQPGRVTVCLISQQCNSWMILPWSAQAVHLLVSNLLQETYLQLRA